MTRSNPSRGRRTQQRAAERRALRQGRDQTTRLEVPEHIRRLTHPENTDD